MSTPNYKGQNQPTATSGGWVSDWFGSSSPVYKPAPTPPSTSTSTPSPTASPSPSPTSAPTNASAKRRRAFVVLPDGREVEVVIPCASDDDATADDDAIDPNE